MEEIKVEDYADYIEFAPFALNEDEEPSIFDDPKNSPYYSDMVGSDNPEEIKEIFSQPKQEVKFYPVMLFGM